MKKALMIAAASAAEVAQILFADSLVTQAMEIADATVRADIVIYAKEVRIEDVTYYDTSTTAQEDSQQGFDAIQRALRYIDKRGDVLPFVMKRHIGCKSLVWFEDKEIEANQ